MMITNVVHGRVCDLRVLVAHRFGRRTSDLALMSSIPTPGVIRHLDQLSFPSFRGR